MLRKRGQDKIKKILNISSFLGSIGDQEKANPTTRGSAYGVSKAALNMLTKMNAIYLSKERFSIICMHPGWVKTDMGGDSAPVEQVDSIAGMLKKLDSVTLEDNGGFFNYTGEAIKW